MRNIYLIVIILGIFQSLVAQEEQLKNNYVLGGSLNFSIQNNNPPFPNIYSFSPSFFHTSSFSDSKYTSVAINPYFGKEVNEKLILGVELGYRHSISNSQSYRYSPQFTDTLKNRLLANNYSLGLFARYSFNTISPFSIYIIPHLNGAIHNEKGYSNSQLNNEYASYFFVVGAGFGITYDINKKFRAIMRSGGIQYVYGQIKDKETGEKQNYSSFGTNINLSSISFGLEYLF